jgi:hypothetical protein
LPSEDNLSTRVIRSQWYHREQEDAAFFQERWNEKLDDFISELIWCCGWRGSEYYLFDLLYPAFAEHERAFAVQSLTQRLAPTVARYFRANPNELYEPLPDTYPRSWKAVRRYLPLDPANDIAILYQGLRRFAAQRAFRLLREGKAQWVNRVRICHIDGGEFSDTDFSNSTSFYHRTLRDWDTLRYRIDIGPGKLDPFRRAGSEEDVRESLRDLRSLLEHLGFAPTVDDSVWSILGRLPREPSMDTFDPASHGHVQSGQLRVVPKAANRGQRRAFTPK